MVRVVIIILLIKCSLNNNDIQLNKPPDIKKAIEIIDEFKINNSNEQKKIEIVKETLNDCQDYSDRAYNKYLQCVKESEKNIDKIKNLEKKILDLEDEISPWRMIKRIFWAIFIGFLIFLAIKIYLKFKPI